MPKKARTYSKECRMCGSAFQTGCWDKKYCSAQCRTTAFVTGHADYNCGQAACKHCGAQFEKKHLRHAYCSPVCKVSAAKARGGTPTEVQYARVSGDWSRYFLRLQKRAGRGALSPQDLVLILHQQNMRCALTGVPLTCTLIKGARTWTNASIDRIVPGGAYEVGNVRLVCARINVLRSNMADAEFLYWCKLVVAYMESQHAT